ASDDGHDDGKKTVAHAEGDLGRGADAEIEDEQRQDGDLRHAVEQEDDRHEALARERLQPDGKPDRKPDNDRKRESDGELPERDAQGRGYAAGGEQGRQPGEHAGGRAQKYRVHPPARGAPPEGEQEKDDGDARAPRPAERPPPCVRGRHGRFPRASSADTSALRIAAIATTKAI